MPDELSLPSGDPVALLNFQDLPPGVSAAQRLVVTNNSATDWTRVRIAAILSPDTLTEDDTPNFDPNLQGAEAMDERWVEVRCLGVNGDVEEASPSEDDLPYHSIGGPYGLEDDGSEEGPDNFLALPDLAAGDYAVVEVRVRMPEDMESERQSVLAFLLSFQGDMS